MGSGIMNIITWNVNSVKARLPHLLLYLKTEQPDVLLLQELKCEETAFPFLEIEDAGYTAAVYGQKTYNGVAILTKHRLEEINRGLPCENGQARYIEGLVAGWLRVASVYVPNGEGVDSEKYPYKLAFYEGLTAHVRTTLAFEEAFVLGGDFNVAATDVDIHTPPAIQNRILCSAPERTAFRGVLATGLLDSYRTLNPTDAGFSWWDYRTRSFERNEGWRIDYVLASPQAMDMAVAAAVHKTPRGWERPSDHTPVVLTLKAP
jgi:exodeoxyribonuclease III